MADKLAWAEYWCGPDSGAEAVGGVYRHKLAAQWTALLSNSASTSSDSIIVIDIAAGAGAALVSAIGSYGGKGLFIALDTSPAAISSAVKTHGATSGVASDAARLPFRNAAADIIISQFGIEYAGDAAFCEAARILAPGGRFCSISHYAGGAIDVECAENERLLGVLVKAQVVETARATLDASFSRRSRRDPAPVDAILDLAFASALGKAQAAVRAAPASAARATLERFLADLTRLSARRMAYAPEDALGWLFGMQASLDAYLRRMQSMRASALDSARIARIAAQFEAAGLVGFVAKPLRLDEDRAPAAWVIDARRPPNP